MLDLNNSCTTLTEHNTAQKIWYSKHNSPYIVIQNQHNATDKKHNATQNYGGPIGCIMRLFLRNNLYATTPNFYATVANLDALVTNLDAIILVYSAVAKPLHAHNYNT